MRTPKSWNELAAYFVRACCQSRFLSVKQTQLEILVLCFPTQSFSSNLSKCLSLSVTSDTVKVEVWDVVDKGGCGLINWGRGFELAILSRESPEEGDERRT